MTKSDLIESYNHYFAKISSCADNVDAVAAALLTLAESIITSSENIVKALDKK